MTDNTPRRIPPWATALIIFLLAMLARGGLLYYRLAIQGTELRWLGGSDVPGWLGIANYIGDHWDFGYWLLGSRQPLFPITVALVGKLGGSRLHAAILQTIFGGLTAVVGYLMARRIFHHADNVPNPDRLALLAGVIMALDPASVSASVTLLSEPLFNLLFTACILNLVLFVQSGRWRDLALSALWMALAMLARPTPVYFWVIAALVLILLGRRWKAALVIAAVGLALYVGWCANNLRYRGVFTYSTGASFNLLFLRALSAEHVATGATPQELYVEYVRTIYERAGDTEAASGDISPEHFWRFLVPETPTLYREMGRLGREKLLAYWPWVILTTPIGLARMYGWTLMLPTWSRPIETVYHILLYGGGLWGAWVAFRRKDWQTLLLMGAPIFYVTGVTLISQTSAMDTRMRSMLTAPLVILAIYGASAIHASLQKRRSEEPS
jgi:4-amino-4-deoxy-L-arabinose transferase-like glycosyltransferase